MSTPRPQIDRCPGLTRPFHARDGAIVRIRKPGGRLPVEVLRHLGHISARWGDGNVHMTTRTNLQVRGLPTAEDGSLPAEISDAVASTGMVPATHELVRNVLASPLPATARPDNPPRDDVYALVAQLDDELLDTPELADLPGRFLWAFDDGAGDVAIEPWDLCYQAIDADFGLVATDAGQVWEVSRQEAVGAMIGLARDFQRVRLRADGPVWHPHELDAEALAEIGADLGEQAEEHVVAHGPVRIGRYGMDLVAGVPLGLFTPAMVAALPAMADITMTPWRSILVPGGSSMVAELAAAGFVTDPEDPWASISACTGLPNCQRSAIDTVALARELVAAVDQQGEPLSREVHISGCQRRCGEPHADHVDLLAPADLDAALAQLRQEGLVLAGSTAGASDAAGVRDGAAR